MKPRVLSALHLSSPPPGYQDSQEPTTLALPAGLPANNTLQDSLSKAREMLGDGNRSDRMLIIMLSSRHDRLCCVFQNLARTVFPLTPSDLIIFSISNSAEGSVNAACPLVSMNLTNVYFMALDEHWYTPPEAGPPEAWAAASYFGDEYRRMGRWRLQVCTGTNISL